ncbi:TIGR02679 domain-containing protein [Mariniluteicoccus endophyticus]
MLAEIRRRIEQRRCGSRTRIDIPLTRTERRQVGAMLDAAWAEGDGPVVVSRLRAGLAHHGAELEELLETLDGPLRDLPSERSGQRAEKEAELAEARGILRQLDPNVPDVVAARCLTGSDVLGRAYAVREVVTAMTAENERLPVLAARLFRDAHALDRSRPLGRAVARFLSGTACEVGDDGVAVWQDPVEDAEAWRAAWATRGVVCDEVSTQVLVLNLPLVGAAPAATLVGLRGEPVWLTLRSLRGGLRLGPGVEDVFVCENPSIVEAAADRHGDGSRPLVCTFGVPSHAAIELLRVICAQATLHVHADEDTVGRRIVESLLRLRGARRWRMDSTTLRYEEEVLAELLSDLG